NFAKLLELQLKSVQHPSFNAEEVTRAAKLVAQADRLKLDDPLSYGQQRILQAAFEPASVAAQTSTQTSAQNGAQSGDETRLVTKEQAQAFYDQHYTANNIIVAIVGDVAVDQALQTAQLFLGSMTSGKSG